MSTSPTLQHNYARLVFVFLCLFLAIVFIFTFTSCKKEDGPNRPDMYKGRWKLTHYTVDSNHNNIGNEKRILFDTSRSYILEITNDNATTYQGTAGNIKKTTYTWQITNVGSVSNLTLVASGGTSNIAIAGVGYQSLVFETGTALSPKYLGVDSMASSKPKVWVEYTRQ